MTQVKIIGIGSVKEKYLTDAIAEYEKRLSAFCRVETVILREESIRNEENEKEIEGALAREGEEILPVLSDGGNHFVSCAMPIICAGDIVGCVASVTDNADMGKDRPDTEVEQKLILTAAGFLGRQLEG